MSINSDIENIVEYLTNSVNIASKFYEIFLDTNPHYVTFEQYDDNNQLIEVTIPNRAMDSSNIKTGDGSPEGLITADVGTLYIDTATPQLYIKVTGIGNTGWVGIPNQDDVIDIIENYLDSKDFVTEEVLDDKISTYLVDNSYVTEETVTSNIESYLVDNSYVTEETVTSEIGNYLVDNDYATKSDITSSIGNGTITFVQGTSTKGVISMNQKGNATITFDSGGGGGGGTVDVDQVYSPDSTNPQSGTAIAGAGFLRNLIIDQTYNATSTNPQSGTAVAQAVSSIPSVIVEQTYNPTSTNAISGTGVAQAISEIEVEQTYNPTGTVATSGTAVAQAISEIEVEQTYNPTSTNAISGTGVSEAGFITEIPEATDTSFGAVKYDNVSLTPNENEQLEVVGITERNNFEATKFWVGTEEEYNNLEEKDSRTIYIIKDTES